MESSFVEQAAREAAQARIVEGDAEADALLAQARAGIYHWPEHFAGFACRLVYSESDMCLEGTFRCGGSRRLEVVLPELSDGRWVRFQLEELIAHREAPSVSKMASKTGCALGDWDSVYGRRIDFLGDKMSSFYRVRDGKLAQIGRSYGKQSFIINIDDHQECNGRWAASFYTAYYWEKGGGRVVKTETYLDRYALVEGVYLPAERRVSEATDAGLRVRQLLLRDPALL